VTTSYFIAGTDTDIGKTVVTTGLLRALARSGRTAIGMKPVASGAELADDGLRNHDAIQLLANSTRKLAYETINPVVFADPTSPNIAAALAGAEIRSEQILPAYTTCRQHADIVLVEGVGGWRVPFSESMQTVDLVRQMNLAVILVCGIRLGCINHSLLSASAIVDDGIQLAGWIANTVDPDYTYGADTIKTIGCAISAPLLAVVPWQKTLDLDGIADALKPAVAKLWT
jgi:dethiobiotin synthetase